MTAMPHKGISSLTYNFLNLPTQIVQNTNTTQYIYRADGVKLKKTYTLINAQGTKTINTEYLDGFRYSTPNTEPLRIALEEQDDATVSAARAGNEEAFSSMEERPIAPGNPPAATMILSFFPTAEGFYDYENLRYIYQYKDHLGNVRVSYVRERDSVEIMDTNDYYPFGLSFLKPTGGASQYDPMALPYNYKYNGKELQETGMYDYGARMYMPDIGRWGVVDPLAETSRRWSPYTYAYNNPIRFIDPDGRQNEDWVKKGNNVFFDSRVNDSNVNTLYGKDATNLGANPTYTTQNSSGQTVDNLNLNADGSITDNNTGNDVSYTTTLGGNTVTSGDAFQREDSWGFYADGTASLDVGPQLRASGEFMGVKLGVSAQNTVSNGDILDPGNPNAVNNKSFGLQVGLGAKETTQSVRGNIVNETTEVNLGIVNVVSDNNYIKINMAIGGELGVLVVGGTLSGEVGVKIKK